MRIMKRLLRGEPGEFKEEQRLLRSWFSTAPQGWCDQGIMLLSALGPAMVRWMAMDHLKLLLLLKDHLKLHFLLKDHLKLYLLLKDHLKLYFLLKDHLKLYLLLKDHLKLYLLLKDHLELYFLVGQF